MINLGQFHTDTHANTKDADICILGAIEGTLRTNSSHFQINRKTYENRTRAQLEFFDRGLEKLI